MGSVCSQQDALDIYWNLSIVLTHHRVGRECLNSNPSNNNSPALALRANIRLVYHQQVDTQERFIIRKHGDNRFIIR